MAPHQGGFAMTVTVCPAATIDAPIERVWSLLMDPRKWTDWSLARLEAAIPDGPLQVGQRLHFSSRAFGKRWHAVTTVKDVAPERHSLDVDVSVPFGIVNHEHLRLSAFLMAGRTSSSAEISHSRPGGGVGWSSTCSEENWSAVPKKRWLA
jgi:ligand-binding SRPBCC domain-containing protein